LRRRSITERYSAAAVWHVHSFALAGRAPSFCGAQGLDFRLSRVIGLGPTIDLSMGQFEELSVTDEGHTSSASLRHRRSTDGFSSARASCSFHERHRVGSIGTTLRRRLASLSGPATTRRALGAASFTMGM
jgi:hypothetical protein